MIKEVERLVKRARKCRQNRAYYEKYFDLTDLRKAGIVQDYNAKTQLDLVELEDPNRCELIYLYGFDQTGNSYFELTLSVISLYPDGPSQPASKWRLARVNLQVILECSTNNVSGGCKFSRYNYEFEQPLDYEVKRQAGDKHENSNIYKIGSLTLETVQPYSLSRLLLNGPMLVEEIHSLTGLTLSSQWKPIRLSISCHPTCDKFDYTYHFDTKYTASAISKSIARGGGGLEAAERLLGLALEDRFDQPLMFEGQLEDLAESLGVEPEAAGPSEFMMWGAKVKKFARANELLTRATSEDEARQCFFAWTECGQQIHLTRPKEHENLVYGFAHGSYDYASPLQELSLQSVAGETRELEFDKLSSFAELASGDHVIRVRAFQKKEFKLEFPLGEESVDTPKIKLPTRRIKINGYPGWAWCVSPDLGAQIRIAQERFRVMNIHDYNSTGKLAEERLLGGKGHSLVQLARLVHYEKRLARAEFDGDNNFAQVSVPRGLVVTSKAYECWLASDFAIASSLRELDAKRRVLAARSALHLDPLDREHVSPAEVQRQLKKQCEATRTKLLDCSLPNDLAQQIREQLEEIFGNLDDDDSDQGAKAFAVRSSCVGEDSLETSAAGQMKTFLGVKGFAAIARAIVECWLSQFELEALTYKSQNGLQFNLPMAVVVQELVQCHVAGVAATCDPLTGNKSRYEITANLGLGEGVVAGRKTDTIRCQLCGGGDGDKKVAVQKILTGSESGQCCLSDEQIQALGYLLIKLRDSSETLEREVEWGITLFEADRRDSSTGGDSPSASSSSSSSNSQPGQLFQIHLLQSRPLTHLQRLSSREILHELDYGMPCPLDLVSRANLGEVMPGALSPLYLSCFNPLATSYLMRKPFEENHTRCPYVADNMTFHGQMAISMLTYSDSAKRFAIEADKEVKKSRAVLYSMIGTTVDDQLKDQTERDNFERLCREKVHPLKPEAKINFPLIMAAELVMFPTIKLRAKRELRQCTLTEDLIPLEKLFGRLATSNDLTDLILQQQITKLYERLLTNNKLLGLGWLTHIIGSFTSIAFNVITMKLLSEQPGNENGTDNSNKKSLDLTSTEMLNDFTVLMRGKSSKKKEKEKTQKQTESGDIARLLSELLESFVDEDRLEQMRTMSMQELYDFLNDTENGKQLRCCQLYCNFIEKNGHRAWKEFCMSTQTWGDTPSSIVKLLAARLKSYTPDEAQKERERREEQEREHQVKLEQVVEKIQSNRLLLLKWAVPKARSNAIRREGTKSFIIRVIHKYRLAFRHLGGLMCLAGLLPSADLIYQLTIQEIDEIVRKCCSPGANPGARDNVMPRLLYKARRRQQRARLVDKVTMPRPTLPLREMVQVIADQTSDNYIGGQKTVSPEDNQEGGTAQVKGLISCGGCVTGRACVISSLDEADQIEPNDILITYSIDISWSVYFYSLAGIVTEVGGIVSHGAVVAREYGLPTLCTAVGACSKFKTGQMVTLDANKGICYLASEETTE